MKTYVTHGSYICNIEKRKTWPFSPIQHIGLCVFSIISKKKQHKAQEGKHSKHAEKQKLIYGSSTLDIMKNRQENKKSDDKEREEMEHHGTLPAGSLAEAHKIWLWIKRALLRMVKVPRMSRNRRCRSEMKFIDHEIYQGTDGRECSVSREALAAEHKTVGVVAVRVGHAVNAMLHQ